MALGDRPGYVVSAVLLLAPIMNLFTRFGVLLFPSHNTQPVGILFALPDHATITPLGNAAFDPAGPGGPGTP